MLEIKPFVGKLVEFKMTPNQFFFCYLIHNDRFAELYEYVDKVGTFDKKEIDDLLKRGYIENINENGKFTADAFVTTEKFTRKFLANKDVLAKEFMEAYPSFGNIDGKPIVLKSILPDVLFKLYNNITNREVAEHKRIMAALEKGKTLGLVNMKIEKWLESRQWTFIEKDLKYANKPGDREFTAD